MHAESSATPVVAALSVVVAVGGHVLAGGTVSLQLVSPLLALTAVCWLLGEYLAGERALSVVVLAAIQLFVHVTLDAAPMPMHHETMPRGIGGSLLMTAAHLTVLLAGVLAITGAHRWVHRVLRTFARLLPRLPILTPVRRYAAVLLAVPPSPRLVQRWLTSNVSRRGPPVIRAIPAMS
jgi:hypothetical protein